MKRVLMWIGGIAFVIGIIINMSSSDEEEVKKEEATAEVDKKETKEETEKKEEKPTEYKVDIDETIELNGATIVLQSLRVKENTADLYAYWNHTSQYDKAHLDLLVTSSFKQGDEHLEIIKGDDNLLNQRDKGIDGSLDLTLELIDESPIEIKFIANTDDAEEEKVTIELE